MRMLKNQVKMGVGQYKDEKEERVSSWSYDREIISFNKGNKTYKEAIDHMHIQEGEMF